jgi:arginine:ornithine antiporter/lysine permease
MTLPALAAMMVGSMIGSGIFMLSRRFGDATGVFGADRLGGRRSEDNVKP